MGINCDTQPGVLRVYNAIIDSSDRYQGVVLKKRFSHHQEFRWGGSEGAWHWTIRKLQLEEKGLTQHECTTA